MPTPRHRVLANEDAVRDVGPEVGLEVGDQWQRREVDVVAERDLVEHWPALDLAHRPGLPGPPLVGLVQLAQLDAEPACDTRPRGEQVRHQRRAAAVDVVAPDDRPLAARRQLPHQRGDVLVGRDPLVDDEHVVGVLLAVARQAVVQVLRSR